ncbi:MAG: hypothetical protein ABI036_20600 [Fibrobacteria bacterium]
MLGVKRIFFPPTVRFRPFNVRGIAMSKPYGTKATAQSLNAGAPVKAGAKGSKAVKAEGDATVGGKGDKDGKGDIRAKKSGTSIGKRTASK